MLIRQGVLMIERVHRDVASFWEVISYLGSARSKIVCLYPLLRLSTLLQEEFILNWFR